MLTSLLQNKTAKTLTLASLLSFTSLTVQAEMPLKGNYSLVPSESITEKKYLGLPPVSEKSQNFTFSSPFCLDFFPLGKKISHNSPPLSGNYFSPEENDKNTNNDPHDKGVFPYLLLGGGAAAIVVSYELGKERRDFSEPIEQVSLGFFLGGVALIGWGVYELLTD